MDITPAPAAPSRGSRIAKAGALVAAGALAATALTGIAFGVGSPAPAAGGTGGYGYGMGAPDGFGPGAGPGAMGAGAGMAPDDRGPAAMGMGLGGRHGGPGMGLGGQLLHGDAVVKDRAGKIISVRMQAGTVVSATASEVVIKSEDGLTQTWPVTSTTKVSRDHAVVTADKLVAGDVVRAFGTVSGTTVTTVRIMALDPATAAKDKAERDARRLQRQQGRNGAAPAPSPTA